MKTIIAPKKRTLNMKTGLVSLWFDPDRSIAPDGRYRMMGGMFFPSQVQDADGVVRNVGYAMMTGIHIRTKVMYVFEETEWYFVDHILDPDGSGITHEGLVTWYAKTWADYYCSTYAVRQPDDTQFRYILDFSRCAMIQPKPDFLDAEWDDPAQPLFLIDRANQLQRIKYSRTGILFPQLDQRKADADADRHDYPAVHALQCVAMITDRYYSREFG